MQYTLEHVATLWWEEIFWNENPDSQDQRPVRDPDLNKPWLPNVILPAYSWCQLTALVATLHHLLRSLVESQESVRGLCCRRPQLQVMGSRRRGTNLAWTVSQGSDPYFLSAGKSA